MFSLSDFISGLADRLNSKTAEDIFSQQSVNSGIFPTLEQQTKWKFAKVGNKLQLHDGNIIHQFDYSHEHPSEDFPVTKLEDASYFDFGKDAERTGTAQVHRANPGLIYLTMHDGVENPTITIKHVNENSWRAMPKHKTKEANLDEVEFKKGLSDKLALFDNILKGIDTASNYAADGIRSIGKNPMASAGIGLGLGAAYDLGKRHFYNTDEENEQEDGLERAMRYVAPAAGLGLVGSVMHSLTPNYYKYSPVYDHTNPASHIANTVPSRIK